MKNHQIKQLNKFWIGRRILIKPDVDHPWAGFKGRVLGIDSIGLIRKPGLLVRLENAVSCYVMDSKFIELLDKTEEE